MRERIRKKERKKKSFSSLRSACVSWPFAGGQGNTKKRDALSMQKKKEAKIVKKKNTHRTPFAWARFLSFSFFCSKFFFASFCLFRCRRERRSACQRKKSETKHERHRRFQGRPPSIDNDMEIDSSTCVPVHWNTWKWLRRETIGSSLFKKRKWRRSPFDDTQCKRKIFLWS